MPNLITIVETANAIASGDSTKPFHTIIRNSIHSADSNQIRTSAAVEDDNNILKKQPCDQSSLPEKRHQPTIIRLVEMPKGTFRLDFNDDGNDCFMTTFLDESAVVNDTDDGELYIDENAWNYLLEYASLVDQDSNVGPLQQQTINPSLFGYNLGQCIRLEEKMKEVILTLLPFERLFAWKRLKDARTFGYVTWKDIRRMIRTVRNEIPFLSENGMFRHNGYNNLTFRQFIAFSKLLHSRIEKSVVALPQVSCRLVKSELSSASIELVSDHDCDVYLAARGCAEHYPSSSEVRNNDHCSFVAHKRIVLKAGIKNRVELDGLNANSSYNVFLHVEKIHNGNGNSCSLVISSNADVAKSRFEIATQDIISNIPSFRDLNAEMKECEVLACFRDKNVKEDAAKAGVRIPSDSSGIGCNSVVVGNDSWRTFVKWWEQNEDVRKNFCTREINFASRDSRVQRYAEANGILLRERERLDPNLRKEWMKSFVSWYYGVSSGSVYDFADESQSKPTINRRETGGKVGVYSKQTDRIFHLDENKLCEETHNQSDVDLCIGDSTYTSAVGNNLFAVGGTITSPRVPCRQKLLSNVINKFDKVRSNVAKLASDNFLHGANLFRSKVRQVIQLLKLAPGKAILALRSEGIDIFQMDDELAFFDSNAFGTNSKKKEMKVGNFDPELIEFHVAILCRKAFTIWSFWAHERISMKGDWQIKMRMANDEFAKKLSKKMFCRFRTIAFEKGKGSEEASSIKAERYGDPKGCEESKRSEEPSCSDQVICGEASAEVGRKDSFEESEITSAASTENDEQNDVETGMEADSKETFCMELEEFSFEDIVSSQLRDKSNNWRTDCISSISNVATWRVPLEAVSLSQSGNGNSYELKEEHQIKTIESRSRAYSIDLVGFKKMRREKLLGLSNVYDVPTEYTNPQDGCSDEVNDTSVFRMRENLHAVTQNENI